MTPIAPPDGWRWEGDVLTNGVVELRLKDSIVMIEGDGPDDPRETATFRVPLAAIEALIGKRIP